MYKVGVIGIGVVGQGIVNLFKDDVTAKYDPHHGFTDIPPFKEVDLAVICVPTRQNEDNTCDTSIVESTLQWLEQIKFDGVVLIKSAVVPSEVQRFVKAYHKLRLVVSPEYMGESKYFTPPWKYPDPKNMEGHTWQVFGGEKKDTSLCVDIFKRKMGVDCVFIQTNIMTAALTKYMENCFFATKVTFCNEWFDIAEAYGVDYNELRECWLADPRINRNHTLVFPKDRGYGGRCFPKDMAGIISDLELQRGYVPHLLLAAQNVNTNMREKNGIQK